MNTHHYQQALANALHHCDSAATAADDLCQFAYGVWFDGFTPDLSPLSDVERLKAAYVLDFLMSNPLVGAGRRAQLQPVLEEVAATLSNEQGAVTFYLTDDPARTNRDQLAKKWHLASGMRPAQVGLLDMQRRANLPAHAA
ncbi:hypothetical protein C4K68_07665 [Pokkaliibacter plantistimulans]|uniref:Uncharacterized protein n=1 Tax=Proteobacteria bacterium 228 TaxID=2083153 RepID=A0A2S5KSU9_9PROT|nr:hypothetical protein [Pokkaliibacter plantistimulans]PPC77914.1 hypothetical protein C4K68_07665 [Pokkaliibacter plantistimulans]